ncbi:RNA methyltransferase [bacterium]|nr:RNA methyltransferase [bacterium]
MPTQNRLYRVLQALHRRQFDLVLALDRVHDPHNLSAVIRTADATGVSQVIWEPDEGKSKKLNPEVSLGTERWVNLKQVPNLLEALNEYRGRKFKLAATDLNSSAIDFRAVNWTQPWVLIMGNEHSGCREEILRFVDEKIKLPMVGLVQSLNISVATAVFLYEIQRQRETAGLYKRVLPLEEIERLYLAWNLASDGFNIQELLTPWKGLPPQEETEHFDGRT